jgi:uncharacterized protein YajQ (UPF0234 family)
MPSFDVVSEFDLQEARNAVDQANREVDTRFDFKGTGSKFTLEGNVVLLRSEAEFQLQQMLPILHQKLATRQKVVLRSGLDAPLAKELVKTIKGSKLKVQAAIQGDKLRVTGKKKDDLQAAIALLKQADVDMPLQFDAA